MALNSKLVRNSRAVLLRLIAGHANQSEWVGDLGFLINCPNCGERGAYEFTFGGEVRKKPSEDSPELDWMRYIYMRKNIAGVHKEWCYHRFGCRKWFMALRDTRNNVVVKTFWAEEDLGK